MRRPKFNSLWVAITVSILLHLAFFRFVSFEKEPDKQETERYNVKLLYYKPLPEETIKPKPKKVKKKKEVVKKPVQKKTEERPEEDEKEEIVKQTEVMKEEVEEEEEEKRFEEELALVEEVKGEESEIQGQEETASFDISPILEGLRRRISERKIYPYIARKKGLQGVVFIILKLDESGNPIEVKVTQSSGHKVLDNAALSLVEKALPYKHGLGQPFTLEIPIRYSLFE